MLRRPLTRDRRQLMQFAPSSAYLYSAAFTTPGLYTPPAWFSFACASSGRTAIITPSSMIRSIAANQAVCNIYGLQHEPQATNYCCYSENFDPGAGGWANAGGCTINSYAITDPCGNATGLDLTSTNQYYYMGGFAQVTTVATASVFMSAAASPNNGGYSLCYNTVAIIASYNENPITSSWHRTAAFFSGTSGPVNYLCLGDLRVVANPSRGLYSFPQVELLPWASSYIPTPSSPTPTTRAATIVQTTGNVTANWKAAYAFRAGAASTAATSPAAIFADASNGNTIGFDAAGNNRKFLVSCGGVVTGANANTWTAGDKVELRASISGTALTLKLYINGTLTNTETLTMPVGWSAGHALCFGSIASGANQPPQLAALGIGVTP